MFLQDRFLDHENLLVSHMLGMIQTMETFVTLMGAEKRNEDLKYRVQ